MACPLPVCLLQFNGGNPWWAVYTPPTGSNDAVPNFYHVRKNFVGLKTPATVPAGTTVLLYYGENPSQCGYFGPVPRPLRFQLNDHSGSFHCSPAVCSAQQISDESIPVVDKFGAIALSTNSATTAEVHFVVSRVGVKRGASEVPISISLDA